jgi:GNAT superfamily N-acetyltransferase
VDDVRRRFTVTPLTPDRWPDLEELFGERGATSGCWCMWWRLGAAQWEQAAGAANRRSLRALVDAGPPPGLLAYDDGRVVGWVAVAPRAVYLRLNRSPKLKPVDEAPVWAVTCFSIDRRARGSGVAGTLLAAAAEFARRHEAAELEGYPIDPGDGTVANAAAFTGVLDMFRAVGFDEITRRGGRPILRRAL